MEIQSPRYYQFGEFILDSRRRILTKNDREIPISAKNYDLLFELIKNEGRILTHDEILDSVWEGTFVEQSNLKKGISALRQILGETPDSSFYIKTVPRKGYSFVAPLRTFSDEEPVRFSATEIVVEEEIIEDEEPTVSFKPNQSQLPGQRKTSPLKFALPILAFILIPAAALTAYWFFVKNQKPTQFSEITLESLKPQRLSTGGDINEATLSGDGKFFVYALRESDGKQSLWLRRLGSMNALNLIAAAKVDYRSLAVSADNDSVFYGISVENSKDVLYQIPILGGTPRKILEDISSAPTFSPDSKRFGFVRDKTGVGRNLLIYNLEKWQEEGEIFAVTGDNHGLINPKFSPDGNKLAFISSEKTADGRTWVLNEIPATGGKPRQIFPPRKGKIFDYRWLNDGSGIIMSAELNDTRQSQLWKVNTNSGEITRLTNDLLNYFTVNLSSDGKSILTVQEDRQGDLWKADFAKPTEAEQITRNLNLPNRFTILPDGRFLAESVENASQTISVINSDGTDSQQFLPQAASERAPSLTPDGKYVYYISRNSGSDQIWRAEINGSNQNKLTDGATFVISPKRAPDGNHIYFEQYTDTSWKLAKMPKDGGEITLVSEDTINNYDFSPDGKLLIYNFLDPNTNKWKIRIRNFPDNSIVKDFEIFSSSFLSFTPDGKSFIYTISDLFRDGGNLWLQSLDGNAPKPLIELKNEKIYWADFSADGKNLFYTRGKTTSSAVLLSLENRK